MGTPFFMLWGILSPSRGQKPKAIKIKISGSYLMIRRLNVVLKYTTLKHGIIFIL